ncbi:MAG: HAMP domain-containing protein, partial [Ardenticatenaceae bacterium]|nr:HAMP domain-containing protein [Ardenticatenaceae bacterium]
MIRNLKQTLASIGAKIILPYVVLSLVVAAVGAYIVTQLVVGSVQERVENQLLDAGRSVAQQIVADEDRRLGVLRLLAAGEGIPEALVNGEFDTLQELVSSVAMSERATAVYMLNQQGVAVVSWRDDEQSENEPLTNVDFSSQPDVMWVLEGNIDEYGNKRIFLVDESPDYLLFTVAPVIANGEVVGAALVGTSLRELALNLAAISLAHVTFYNQQGVALATSMAGEPDVTLPALAGTAEQYGAVLERLQAAEEVESVVLANENDQAFLSQVEVLSQVYLVAFGDWRLRAQSFGLFSMGLSADFITTRTTTSRNLFFVMFVVLTFAVFIIGLLLARRITEPLKRLVVVSTAVSQGDLEQRTNISQQDEIGVLATSFDTMTQNLAQRNRQLVEQKSELEAILNSIADAVIVIDNDNEIVASNPAADKLLNHINSSQNGSNTATYLQSSKAIIQSDLNVNTLMSIDTDAPRPTRFRVGSRVFGISASPFKSPEGSELGRVVVLRDETRQVESEQLKDGFITSISHELRTPLTSMKGYIHLLNSKNADNLTTQQKQFVEILQNSTELIVNHVNKLIDITSIQEGSLRLKKKHHSFTEIVNSRANEWRSQMQNKGLNFEVTLAPDLWIMADRARLDWAIDNILRNAHVYTLEGGKVTVCLFQKDDLACLQIVDTGVGISEVDQPYIFTRFYRAQNELTLNVPGLGIELYVAKSIVQAHDGRIWV